MDVLPVTAGGAAGRKVPPVKRGGGLAQRTVRKRPSTPPAISEARFMAQVVGVARLRNWITWHQPDSRRSTPGVPDLLFLRKETCFWAELKTEKGRVSPVQVAFIAALREAGQTVYIWRPSSWLELCEVLA